MEKVDHAVKIAQELRPDLPVEGPIQYDAAVDPVVAAVKIKTESKVAGRATVCVFPDLNTGNNTYKVGPIYRRTRRGGWYTLCLSLGTLVDAEERGSVRMA